MAVVAEHELVLAKRQDAADRAHVRGEAPPDADTHEAGLHSSIDRDVQLMLAGARPDSAVAPPTVALAGPRSLSHRLFACLFGVSCTLCLLVRERGHSRRDGRVRQAQMAVGGRLLAEARLASACAASLRRARSGRRAGCHLVAGKTRGELERLEADITHQLEAGAGGDPEYWVAVLKRLRVWKARAVLREIHVSLLERHLKAIMAEQERDGGEASASEAGEEEVRVLHGLQGLTRCLIEKG
jgi:Conserved mid region of cactin